MVFVLLSYVNAVVCPNSSLTYRLFSAENEQGWFQRAESAMTFFAAVSCILVFYSWLIDEPLVLFDLKR